MKRVILLNIVVLGHLIRWGYAVVIVCVCQQLVNTFLSAHGCSVIQVISFIYGVDIPYDKSYAANMCMWRLPQVKAIGQ